MGATNAKLTVAVCLLAAAIVTVLGCTSTAGLTPGDAIVVLFIVGPYCLLSLFAWRQRRSYAASWMLLVVAVALAALGLVVSGIDSYRYHTEPQYRLVQRMDVFLVTLVQWVAVLAVGLGLLVTWLATRRRTADPADP